MKTAQKSVSGEPYHHECANPQFLQDRPGRRGHFGIFGGRFVAETLMPLILELEQAYDDGQEGPGIPGRTATISTSIMPAGRARSISPSG